MKEVEGSERSEAVTKTKSSSGCLIIEKEATYGVGGASGFSDSSPRKSINLNKEKKRARVVLSDSESSDEVAEPVRQKVPKLGAGPVESEDLQREKNVNNELNVPDELDGTRIGKDDNNGRHKLMLHGQNASQMQSGSGSSKIISYNKTEHDEFNLPLSVSNKNEQDFDGIVGLQEKGVKENSHLVMKPPSTVKVVKRDAITRARMKNVTSVKNKENKGQRASYTEKQMLREKIKKMLLGAGWTIDYRPRRNRDYLDSVYISPSGNAYWSITKAYDVLRTVEKDSSKAGGEFTPLPSEILRKLSRQTRKKLEKEIKKNQNHEGDIRKLKRDKVKNSAQELSQVDESGNSDKETHRKHSLKKSTIHTNSHIVKGDTRKFGRLALLVRGFDTGLNSEDNGSGKRTLLSWLIDSGVVSVGEKVEYMNLRKTRVMQEGWITEDGIHCHCCSKIITILRFELHAGSKLGQPFQNIFVGSGKSLMECQIECWNKQEESERKGFHAVDIDGDDPNDDTCGLCGDGGDLICCDGCPSTFHLSCLDMQMLPQGDWHCPNCVCKYCGGHHRASGRTENPLLTCHMCEKKYHKSCCPDVPIDSNFPFCERKCREVYKRLQKVMWVSHELDSGFSWSLIRRSDPKMSSDERVESNSKLAIALSVMDECFLPIIDRRSGISLIHNVVYNCGSNFSRLNYTGFLTAILEKADEMICAASIRIHGTQLAEMPFIATRHLYRRQGMCRRLLNAIQSALSSLKVEKLVIPAIEEHLHTWTNAFGFSPLDKSQKQQINMLVFPGTDMLYKSLCIPKRNITSHKGKKGGEVPDLNKSLESAAKPNGDSVTKNPSEPEPPRPSRMESDSNANVLKDVVLDDDSGSKAEGNGLQNGHEMSTDAHDITTNASNSVTAGSDSVPVLNTNDSVGAQTIPVEKQNNP